MSEKGYFKARPSAKAVYEARVRVEEEKNFEIFAKGLNFSSAILAVFGVCIGNPELSIASLAMLIAARVFY